uniref:Ig-like domain-containing protein n=1 Tax=Oryzias latipes TaxID=8090 RepID=A0A3P9IDX2_ORYLA
ALSVARARQVSVDVFLTEVSVCFFSEAAVSREKSSQTEIKEPGDTVRLQCCPSGVTQASAAWSKNGAEITFPPPQQQSPPGGRLSLLQEGILSISPVTPEDAGIYLCNCTVPRESSSQTRLLLQVEKLPYPEGTPLVSALEGSNINLSCSETSSFPIASTTWRRGLQQDLIRPGSKYVFSGTNPNFQLTILNVSKEDEGIYFCRSENLLGVRELEISLTVKAASSAYTGAIIGVFLAVLILGSVGIVAKMVYLNRHRICLDGGFTQMEENGDVLSLVESDEEQFYRDAVPQLPPISNDRQTTLVQIHRIPSSRTSFLHRSFHIYALTGNDIFPALFRRSGRCRKERGDHAAAGRHGRGRRRARGSCSVLDVGFF